MRVRVGTNDEDGPKRQNSILSFGPLVCVLFFFRVLFILTYSFFFLVLSTLSHNKQPPWQPNDAPSPHEQHTTTTAPPQLNDEGAARRWATASLNGRLEKCRISSPRYVSLFFFLFFILLMIYLLTAKLHQHQHQHLAPNDTNGKKGPNDGFIVRALGSFFLFFTTFY